MNDWLFRGDFTPVPMDVPMLLLGLVLAFLCGQLIAWVYMITHPGLSYSRTFVSSLVVLPVIVALVMQVLNNNLITAFGLMAVFAIVRFRNILRDTLDTTFVLSTIVIGMACGTQRLASAVLGTVLIMGIVFFLWYTSFGSRHRYDLIINLHWSRPLLEVGALTNLLDRHSLRALCASQRSHEGYEGTDLSYRLLLRDPGRTDDLLRELRELQGVSRLTSIKAEDESEL